MSKNIVIQEGGIGKQLTVDKLKTDLVGGGTCLWVPEDERQLTTKYITEDGTYKASTDGYYGYSEVTVNGIGTVKGKDGDGDDAEASVDPETGNIIVEKLPSSISVVTPPTITTYNDGDAIDFSGMVVKAYTSTGSLWSNRDHPNGVIPIGELTLPDTHASIAATTGRTATSDLIDGEIPIGGGPFYSVSSSYYGTVREDVTYSGATYAFKTNNDDNFERIRASASPGAATENVHRYYTYIKPQYEGRVDPEISNRNFEEPLGSTYTYDNKTVYYGHGVTLTGYDNMPPHIDIPFGGPAAWTIIYGTISGGTQTIRVQWTYKDETLESSFEITVNNSFGGATGGGGEAGDTGAGRND